MRITDLRPTKHGRMAVYGDGEFLFSLPMEVFAGSQLAVGCEMDGQALEELRAQAELKKAKEKALQLLSYKEYTAKQLSDRLARTAGEETAKLAVMRMEELGLVDDADYAMRFAHDLYTRKGYGPVRIRQEMRARGIGGELIEWAMSMLPQREAEELALLVKKKYPLAWEDERIRRRAFAAIMRWGYPAQMAYQVLRMQEFAD